MTLKKKFTIFATIYLVLALIVLVLLLLSFEENRNIDNVSREIFQTAQNASRLQILTLENSLKNNQETRNRWLEHYSLVEQQTQTLFARKIFVPATESQLKQHLSLTLEAFNQLEYFQNNKTTDTDSSKNTEESTQLLQKTLTFSEVLSEELNNAAWQTKNTQKINIFAAYLEIVFLLILLLLLLLLFRKTILSRLLVASKIIERITNGETKIKIPDTKKDDEIGQILKSAKKITLSSTNACNILAQKVQTQTTRLEETLEKTSKQNEDLEKTKKAMLNILEDVREEKEKAENFAQDLRKFMLAAESTSEEIVITNPEGIILYANPAIKNISGFSIEEVVGKKIGTKRLWGGQMKKSFYKNLWRTIKEKKKTFTGEIKNKNKNGQEYWAETSISPIMGEDGEVEFFVVIQKDKTKEKQIDKAKTEFVSLASHQLRTPLSSINWYSEMLLTGEAGKINKQQKDYLKEVAQENQRMIALVNSLLNVSRIELGTFSVDPELVSTTAIVKSLFKELAPEIEKREIIFKKEFGKNLPKIKADKQLIRMVFQNLLTNAIKYTPEKGHVSATMTLKKRGEKVDEKTVSRASICFVVKDSGIGIPQHQQETIFTKLFRADNAKKSETDGNGLGLYIAKSIVNQARGDIWFKSKEGKGTTFYVLLPLEGMQKKEGTKRLA